METIKILLFAANPVGTQPLDLSRELREIDEEIRYGVYREALELSLVPAARPVDLLRKLNLDRPQVVHFSLHGGGEEMIFLEEETEADRDLLPVRSSRGRDILQKVGASSVQAGKALKGVGKQALVDVLRACDAGNLRLVVLNACHTRPLAEALIDAVDCVVCMDREISDRAAIKFAASFYGALAFGRSVRTAFDQAVARLKAEGTSESEIPQLLSRPGVSPEKMILVGGALTKQGVAPPPFTVPFPRNADFLGRDEILERLHENLSRRQQVGIRPAGLTGMGGIGKTQLAVEYAYRHRDDYPGGVFWINAVESLAEGFAALGRRMQSAIVNLPRDEQVLAGFEILNREPETLLILDNLGEPSELNRAVAPGCIPANLSCRLLFTTRRRDLGRFMGVEVTVLPEDSALRLLLRHPDRQESLNPEHPEYEHARAVCRMLGWLPLALELAGAFLGEWSDVSLADFRERLKSEGLLATLDDEAAELAAVQLPAVHEAAVTATLNSQWEGLQDETARLLLRVAGQFPETTLIPIVRLGLLAGVPHRERPGHPSPLARALRRLENACLIEELLGDQLRLHLLVRDFAIKKTPAAQVSEFRNQCAGHVAEVYSHYAALEQQARERGIDLMQEDLIAALEFCSEGNGLHTRLEALLGLFQRESHILRGWSEKAQPALFPQQIHNRAVLMKLEVLEGEAQARLSELSQPHAILQWRASRESSALVRTLAGHRSWINDVVFTPDGLHALSASDDHTFNLWDLQTGRELRTFVGHQGGVERVVLTGDGRRVLTCSLDRTLKLWDLSTGQELRTFSGHRGGVSTVAITPDDRFALSGSNDGTLQLWDLETGENLRGFLGHLGVVTTVAIAAGGRLAVSGSSDATLRIWDLRAGLPMFIMSGHEREVTGLKILPDGSHALSISFDKTLRLWDLSTGRELRTLAGQAGLITALAVLPDGRHILSASDDRTLRLIEIESGRELRTFLGHAGGINAVAVSRDGLHALSGSDDLTVMLWDLRRKEPDPDQAGHRARVNSLVVTPDGSRAVTASSDNTLKFWDLRTGRELRSLVGHAGSVTSVAVTPDGLRVLSSSYDGMIKIWSIEAGGELATFHGHEGGVLTLAVTLDGRIAISGSADRALKLWDLASGQEVASWTGHADRITAVAVSPDGRHVLSASDDSSLVSWNLENGEPEVAFLGHADVVTTVAVTHDGLRALSGSADRTLKLWELATGRLLATFRGHLARVNTVVIASDGRFAVSAAEDRTVRVWNLRSGECVMVIPIDGSPSALALVPGEMSVIVGDGAGHVYALNLVRL